MAIVEVSVVPLGTGTTSVSQYVAQAAGVLPGEKDIKYELTAMGTIIETETLQQALTIVQNSYDILKNDSNRVYSSIKLDIRKNKSGRLTQKIQSIESKIGEVKK